MRQVTFLCYWNNVDPNMLETCVNSLRHVNSATEIVIATELVPPELKENVDKHHVKWILVRPEQVRRRRATCKIEILKALLNSLDDKTELLVSDIDIYFQGNPFKAFVDYEKMDLGVTSRGYPHAFPINGGIFFIRVNNRMKNWVEWHLKEIHKPTWEPYVRHRRRWNHEHYGLDWSVGQDFLVANWITRNEVKAKYNVAIEDVGPKYNYCPPSEIDKAKAISDVKKAVGNPHIAYVIHLKSELKRMIYEDVFPNAVIKHNRGPIGWM